MVLFVRDVREKGSYNQELYVERVICVHNVYNFTVLRTTERRIQAVCCLIEVSR